MHRTASLSTPAAGVPQCIPKRPVYQESQIDFFCSTDPRLLSLSTILMLSAASMWNSFIAAVRLRSVRNFSGAIFRQLLRSGILDVRILNDENVYMLFHYKKNGMWCRKARKTGTCRGVSFFRNTVYEAEIYRLHTSYFRVNTLIIE